eukprot:jgi/Ulvmu1/11776/UM008_0190.1
MVLSNAGTNAGDGAFAELHNQISTQALALASLVQKAAAVAPAARGMPAQRTILGALAALQTALDNTFATANPHFSTIVHTLSVDNFPAWQKQQSHGCLADKEPLPSSLVTVPTKLETPATWPNESFLEASTELELIGAHPEPTGWPTREAAAGSAPAYAPSHAIGTGRDPPTAVTATEKASEGCAPCEPHESQGSPSAVEGSDEVGSAAGGMDIPFRTAAMCKLDASNNLRRLDELLEVARAKLLALVHASDERPVHGFGQVAAVGGAGADAVAASGAPARHAAQHGGEPMSPARAGGDGKGDGALGVLGGGAAEVARRVADILVSVAEASALVQGDLAERLHTKAARCAQLADDKQRLLRRSYDETAQITHLKNLLEASEGRNSALVEQTERAKARKVAAERRMCALDLHVERIEEKMSVHCAKQNTQLQAEVERWRQRSAEHGAAQQALTQLRSEHARLVSVAQRDAQRVEKLTAAVVRLEGTGVDTVEREAALRVQVKQLQAEVEAQRDLIAAQAADLAARALQVKQTQHALAGARHTAQRAQQATADAQQVQREHAAALLAAQHKLAGAERQLREGATALAECERRAAHAKVQAAAGERDLTAAQEELWRARTELQGLRDAVAEATVAAEKAADERRAAEERRATAEERAKAARARVTQQMEAASASHERRAAAEAAAAEAEARAECIARRLVAAEAAAADARVRAFAAADVRERLVDEAAAAQEEARHQRARAEEALQRAKAGEVERLKARAELREALVSVDILVDEKMSLSEMLTRVLERVDVMRSEAHAAAAREAALRNHVAALDHDIAGLSAEVERLLVIESELEELKDDQLSVIKRNKWLETDRVETSARLARSQDAQAALRAAVDKAVAFAAAAADEALAAHGQQQQDARTLLGLLQEIRDSSIAVAGVDLVMPMCVLDTLDTLREKWTAAHSSTPDDPGTRPRASSAVVAAGSTASSASAGTTGTESRDASDAEAPTGGCAGDAGDAARREAGAGDASGLVDQAAAGKPRGPAQVPGLEWLPEGHSAAAVSAALEEERDAVRLRTAEAVTAAAAAYGSLRGALARYLLRAQAALGAAAGAAAERGPVLRALREALSATRAVLKEQQGDYAADSRFLVTITAANEELISELRAQRQARVEHSRLQAAQSLLSARTTSQVPCMPSAPSGLAGIPAAGAAPVSTAHAPPQAPAQEVRALAPPACAPAPDSVAPTPPNPAAERSTSLSTLAPSGSLQAGSCTGVQPARRLALSARAEALALDDERAAAAAYAALVEREEALSAAVRRLAEAQAAVAARDGAMAAAQHTHAREAAQVAATAERMREERDQALVHQDRAVQQRILVEHYSRVLAERLVRQQAAVNAAAAASGRTLDYVSVAVQTSAAVGAAAPPRSASIGSTATVLKPAHAEVVEAAAGGGVLGAALLRRDEDAFQMLVDALHALPRQWLLSLPPRLLRVLAGEGFILDDHNKAAPRAPGATRRQYGRQAAASDMHNPASDTATLAAVMPSMLSTTASVGARPAVHSIIGSGSRPGSAPHASSGKHKQADARDRRFRALRKLPLQDSMDRVASVEGLVAARGGSSAQSMHSMPAGRRQVSFQQQSEASAEVLATVFSEPSIESLPEASAGIGPKVGAFAVAGQAERIESAATPATIAQRAKMIQESLQRQQSHSMHSTHSGLDRSANELETYTTNHTHSTLGMPKTDSMHSMHASGPSQRPQTAIGLPGGGTYGTGTVGGRVQLRPKTAPHSPRGTAHARPPMPQFATAVLDTGTAQHRGRERFSGADGVVAGTACFALAPCCGAVLAPARPTAASVRSTHDRQDRISAAIRQHLAPARDRRAAMRPQERMAEGFELRGHPGGHRGGRPPAGDCGRDDGVDYGRTKWYAGEPVAAHANTARSTAPAVAGMGYRRHGQAHAGLRVALAAVPASALLPPAAAVAIAAVAAAPGGAAVLAAVSRGCVPHALAATGTDLGVAVVGPEARNLQVGDGRAQHAAHSQGPALGGATVAARTTLDMLLLDAARTLGCAVLPLLYVRGDAVARAYFVSVPLEEGGLGGATVGPPTWRLRPAVVVTSATVEMLTEPELRALFGALLTHAVAPGTTGVDAAGPAPGYPDHASAPAGSRAGAAEHEHCAMETMVGQRREMHASKALDASWLHTHEQHAYGRDEWVGAGAAARQQAFAAIGTVATAAGVAEVAPEAVAVLAVGAGRAERAEAAAGGGGGTLACMRAAGRRALRPALRLAQQLLRFAEDRGAMLVAQDFSVVESMIIKMACGSPSLAAHLSIPALRAAAAALPSHALESPLVAAMAAATGFNAESCAAMLQRGCGHATQGAARVGAASGCSAADGAASGHRLAGGDITVVRLAALQRWVDCGEYETIMRSCAVEHVQEQRPRFDSTAAMEMEEVVQKLSIDAGMWPQWPLTDDAVQSTNSSECSA